MLRCKSKVTGFEYEYAIVTNCKPANAESCLYRYNLSNGSTVVHCDLAYIGDVWVRDTLYTSTQFKDWYTPINDRTISVKEVARELAKLRQKTKYISGMPILDMVMALDIQLEYYTAVDDIEDGDNA